MICLVAFVWANLFYHKSRRISLFFNYLKLLVVDNVGFFTKDEKYGNSNFIYPLEVGRNQAVQPQIPKHVPSALAGLVCVP